MAASGNGVLAAELACESTSLWALGRWDAAQQTLQRLDSLLQPPDAKVQLNCWLAEFLAGAAGGLDGLSEQLAVWLDAHRADGGEPTYSGAALAAINRGLALLVQQQHAAALAVLEPLYDEVEALHGGAAIALCVLLLEAYLAAGQLPKAAQVLDYLQQATAAADAPARAPGGDDGDGDAGGEHGKGRGSEASEGAGEQQQQQRGKGQQRGEPPPPPRQHRDVQPQQDADTPAAAAGRGPPAAASLDLPIVSRCTSALMELVGQLVQQQGGGSVPVPDVPALLHLYKARLAMACSNHRAAKKEVRALLALQPASAAGALLKAQLEVLRQQPKKALRTLAPLLAGAGEGPGSTSTMRCRLQLLNLLAAIHQQLGKHHVAALYLGAALAQHQQAYARQLGGADAAAPACSAGGGGGGGKGPPAGAAAPAERGRWLLPDESDALLYNQGLQQLALGDWQSAAECFEAASSGLYAHPHVWLRMAEAGISQYHEQQARQEQQQQRRQQHQPWQRKQQQQERAEPGSAEGGQDAGVALLRQAALNLGTGLALLQEQQAEAAKQAEAAAAAMAAAAAAAATDGDLAPASAAPWLDAGDRDAGGLFGQRGAGGGGAGLAAGGGPGAVALPSSPLEACVLPPDLPAVQQALFANQAYVHLLLNEPTPALEAARALLARSGMSAQHHYLGSCYAAEALCMLGRPEEAVEQLQGHLASFVAAGNSSSHAAAAAAESLGTGTAASDAGGAGGVGSSKSDDGSCAGCRGPCSVAGSGGHAAGPCAGGPRHQGTLLSNLSAALALQGEWQEAARHAWMAAAADAGSASAQAMLQLCSAAVSQQQH